MRVHRRRRSSLTGVAYRIAMRIREISQPYLDRGEEVPRDVLAKEFHDVCDEYTNLRGGELSTEEMKAIAEKHIPKALRQIEQREQLRKEGLLK